MELFLKWDRPPGKELSQEEKLAAGKKLTEEEKRANNCEALEEFLHDVWCISHPGRNIYKEQEGNFWEAEMKM